MSAFVIEWMMIAFAVGLQVGLWWARCVERRLNKRLDDHRKVIMELRNELYEIYYDPSRPEYDPARRAHE